MKDLEGVIQMRNGKKVSSPDFFLDNLRRTCDVNGYFIQGSTSNNPKVVLVGDYHPHNIIWFADNIEKILLDCVQERDIILMEGFEGEILYNFLNIPELPIYNIKKELKNKNIKSFFNDSFELLQTQKIVRKVIQETYDGKMFQENKEAAERDQEIMIQRDKNFVHGDFGINKQIGKGKVYQIIGQTHLQSGDILKHLAQLNISYAVILPEKLPSDELVASYSQEVESLKKGSKEEKCEAITVLKNVPIRRTINFLHEALNDQSGRVRKYAAHVLGKIGSPKSIEQLISCKNDQDMLTRWTIHKALSRFKDSRIEKLASAYLSYENRESWTMAALLMYEYNLSSNLKKIYGGLESDDPFKRALSIHLIGKGDNVSLDKIVSCFDDEHPAVREEAVRLVACIEPERLLQYDLSKETDINILNFMNHKDQHTKFKKNKDKVKGAIYGALIGDAIGAPIESLKLEEIQKKYGIVNEYFIQNMRRGGENPAGSYTDDGELTLNIFESIISKRTFDPFDISQRFAQIGRKIDDDFKKNKGYGFMTLMTFRKLYAGVNWRFTGNNSSGCGSAMRVSPIALIDGENLKDNIIAQAQITHANSLAMAGSLAIGYAVNKAYDLPQNFDKKQFIDRIVEYIKPTSLELAEEIGYIKEYIDKNLSKIINTIPISDSEPKRKGKGTLGTVPAALCSFLKSPNNFEETLINATNHSGDSDSIGSMACAISGSYNGFNKIPLKYIKGLHELKKIESIVEKIS